MAETPETPPIPRAPRGLAKAGKELWKSIHAVFDFTDEPGRVAVLELACRTRDVITCLEEAMEGEPFTVPGSAKQVQVNPLISEARFQRKALAELLARLGLPDNNDPDDLHSRRRAAAHTAARARWDRGN